tara:strand:- start:151 stop:507 length:357 start_codon:yes stop_codon:yes gene_type:complete
MSDQLNSLPSPIKKEVVEKIEQLDLSTLQKLHLKLLTHCLEIFKEISKDNDESFANEVLLRKWCVSEAEKLNDINFANLLFEQMQAAADKLKYYAIKLGKEPMHLDLDDLIILISQHT